MGKTAQLVKTKSIINPDTDALPIAVASLLAKTGFMGDFNLNPLTGGFNNRVFRIDRNGSQICLKFYFQHDDDCRNRMDTEFSFVSFAWDKGVRTLPKPIACNKEKGLALYEFIPGCHLQPGDITADMVKQALRFYNDLNHSKDELGASSLPKASEACFSIASHLACVDDRINKLLELNGSSPIERKAVQFIHGDLLNTWKELLAAVHQQSGRWGLSIEKKIARSDRRISPSDFGFHNAILSADGRLRFIDFEYAGWDDPAKTVSDFFCQPAVPVSLDYYDMFAETIAHGLSEPEYHLRRMELLLPVYRLKWCCILLNDFLPTGRKRRGFADKRNNKNEHKEKQLNKARNALRSI